MTRKHTTHVPPGTRIKHPQPSTVTRTLTSNANTVPYAFQLSNPKNYIGGVIAIAAPGATGALIPQHLVNLPGEVRRGNRALGLTQPGTRDDTLTAKGRAVTEHAERTHGSPTVALHALHELKRSGERFCNAEPELEHVTQAVLATHQDVHSILHAVHTHGPCTLPELVTRTARTHPDTASTLLDTTSTPVTDPVTTLAATTQQEPPSEEHPWLHRTSTYRSNVTAQLKSLCYHAGILTTPGATTDQLTPRNDTWELDQRTHPNVKTHIQTEPPRSNATTRKNGGARE